MWTTQEQNMLVEEVGQRWVLLLHMQEQCNFEEEKFVSITKKINFTEKLFHILNSGDDLSFHFKSPSDYTTLITIVQDFDDSEMKERILAKIERERDGKKFTRQAMTYLREQFTEIKRIRETKGVRYFGIYPQTLVIYVYLQDNYDVDEDEVLQALSKHDYDADDLIQDCDDALQKLYNKVR